METALLIGTLASVLISAASAGYGVYNNSLQSSKQDSLNRLAQSNFENQYQITSKDMQASGFNPSAIFSGGQLNQFTQSQAYQPDNDVFSGLMDSVKNMQSNMMRSEEYKLQKDTTEANIENIKADTISKLLDNEKVSSLLKGPEGNVYLKSILSDLGLNESAKALNDALAKRNENYVEDEKQLIKVRGEQDRETVKKKADLDDWLNSNSHVYDLISDEAKTQLQVSLIELQEAYGLERDLVKSLASDKILYTALVGNDLGALTQRVNEALNRSGKKLTAKTHKNIIEKYRSALASVRRANEKKNK